MKINLVIRISVFFLYSNRTNRVRNNNKLNRIIEPSNKESVFFFKKELKTNLLGGIHQIPKLLFLTLVYRLLENESSQARYSAAVGPLIGVSMDE